MFTFFASKVWTKLPPLVWTGSVAPESCESLHFADATHTMALAPHLDCDSSYGTSPLLVPTYDGGEIGSPKPKEKNIRRIKTIQPDSSFLTLWCGRIHHRFCPWGPKWPHSTVFFCSYCNWVHLN